MESMLRARYALHTQQPGDDIHLRAVVRVTKRHTENGIRHAVKIHSCVSCGDCCRLNVLARVFSVTFAHTLDAKRSNSLEPPRKRTTGTVQ